MSYTSVFGGNPFAPANPSYEALTISANTALAWPVETTGGTPYVASQIDVIASGTGLSIAMPAANTGSTGPATLISNVGSNTFNLTDNGGNLIVSIPTTQEWLISLTNNGSANGAWRAYQLGSTTSNTSGGQILVNIAALRAVAGSGASSYIVQGYYTVNDGGGGIYAYVSTDTTSADNGGTIIVDAVGRRWYLQLFGEPVSIKQFGAKGDGSTDDTVAIQACFTNSNWISIPALSAGQSFICTSTITKTLATGQSFSVVGANKNLSEIRFTSNVPGISITSPTPNFLISPNAVTVNGFAITTTIANVNAALTINGNYVSGQVVADTSVKNMVISGVNLNVSQWLTGVTYNNVAQTRSDDILFCGQYATYTATALNFVGGASSVVTDHDVTGCSIYFATIGVSINPYVKNIKIIGCNIASVQYGVQVAGLLSGGFPIDQQVTITECGIGASICPVSMSSTADCCIANNALLLVAPSANSNVVLMDSTIRCVITGNTLVGVANNDGSVAIKVTNSLSIVETGLPTMIGTNVINSVQTGVSAAAGTSGLLVMPNAYGNVTTQHADAGTGNTFVTVGVNDSGGAGFALLRVPNGTIF